MIVGIGTDLVEVARIDALLKNRGKRFLDRVFTSGEQERALRSVGPANSFAKRFAAKEAFVKALGTGFQDGISFQDIEISNDFQGKPTLLLKGRAREILDTLVPSSYKVSIHLSLSDTHHHALAFVLIAGETL